jgi:SAM-dependent methyltransferase
MSGSSRQERSRYMPPAPVRVVMKAMTRLVVRWPALWPIFRWPTRRFFDWAASWWDEHVRPESAEHLAPLAAAVDHLDSPPERILDLGTGSGAAALWLARRFPDARVVAVDISESMIRAARAKLNEDFAGRVEFVVADASALPSDASPRCPLLYGLLSWRST